jgi:hypothetical protein
VTTVVPAAPLIATFDDGMAAGWGAYPNGTGAFTPGTPTPVAGGANNTAKTLAFTVNQDQGIRVVVGFGTQCQDVRTFSGLSFWAKGTIDEYKMPPNAYEVPANTLIVLIGAEKAPDPGPCMGAACPAAQDARVTITTDWKEYRVPFNCFGTGAVFDGYHVGIMFKALGTMSNFSIDQVGYY